MTYQLSEAQRLSALTHWSLEGRIAYQDAKESFSASLVWMHQSDRDQITLSGPLSQGKVVIEATKEQVVVDDGVERKVYSGNVDNVVAEQLGVHMPVESLRYWVLGAYDPNGSHLALPDGFVQHDWSVRYREMQQVADRLMPRKINAERGATRIKFIVDLWNLS